MPEAELAAAEKTHFGDSVLAHARRDFALLETGLTVAGALARIREHGAGERIIYFYVVDGATGRLAGVLPTRRLLTAALETPLADILVSRVLAIPATATVLEACEFFVLHKFLAFPVVDEERRVVGVVDVNLFTAELLEAEDSSPPEADHGAALAATRPVSDEVFEALGFHLSQLRDASPLRAFRLRFPWLLATVGSGTACALLAGFFEATLQRSLVVAFFLTMVLGLNESVAIQSMTVTIQALRTVKLSWRWFLGALRRELPTAVLLGLGCGLAVAAVAVLWRGDARAGVAIGGSVAGSLVLASGWGLAIPSALHALRLDPKIAAGPITLALTDVGALAMYFTVARMAL